MVTGPARKGKRVELQERPVVAPIDNGAFLYVCGSKPLLVGSNMLYSGVEVPNAANWPRLDSWVNTRRVRKISVDEQHVTYADFLIECQEKQVVAEIVQEAEPVKE